MSHTVTLGSREAKSKQCTGFRTLEARRQSPQPKSATTKDAGLGVEGRVRSLTGLVKVLLTNATPLTVHSTFHPTLLLAEIFGNMVYRVQRPLLYLSLKATVIKEESFRVFLE